MKIIKFFAVLIFIIVLASSVIHFLAVFLVRKTVTFEIPPKSQYKIGEIFPMKMEIKDIRTPINAVQTDLGFDSNKIEVVDISIKDSFANVFIQKQIDNKEGWARLTGGLPNPGYSSDSGLFATVYFKAKNAGLVEIKFLPSSLVLANDGNGTNVLKDFPSVSYLIVPEKISKEDEDKQQTLVSDKSVLGASTSDKGEPGAQLVFFNEDSVFKDSTSSGNVLGSESGDNSSQDKPQIVGFIGVLDKVDGFIVSVWTKILNFRK